MADYEAHDYSGRIRDWHRRRWGRKGLARERRPPAAGGTIRSLDWIGPSCGARRPPPRTFIAHQRNSEKGPAPGRALSHRMRPLDTLTVFRRRRTGCMPIVPAINRKPQRKPIVPKRSVVAAGCRPAAKELLFNMVMLPSFQRSQQRNDLFH